MASGLAAKVRRATGSDEFDLGGYDQARCQDLAKDALSEPLPLSEMVKLSFVVGGGKLVRQKYSDDLPKIFMGALSSVGYQDDSTAALEVASAGKFKFQHDTGKNLKFVHVFPRISPAAQQDAAGEGEEEEEEEERPASHEDIMLRCSDKDFARLLGDNVVTYQQKKTLLEILKSRIATLEAIEAKMTRLEQLSAEEQALFDDVGADEVKEKAKIVSGELKRMVDEGELTSSEKSAFQEELEAKLAGINNELSKAEAEGKAKKVAALTQQREMVKATQASAKESGTANLPALKHGKELQKLHVKLKELNRIEKVSKGHYSMDELKKLGERPEIEEAISVLQARSRGWFESDEVFQERLEACIRAGNAAAAKKPAAGTSRPSSGSGGFQTVSGGARVAKSKASAPSTRNAFSALDR